MFDVFSSIPFQVGIFKGQVPSLKLTCSPLKMDGWKTIPSIWGNRPIFRCELLVLGRVIDQSTN